MGKFVQPVVALYMQTTMTSPVMMMGVWLQKTRSCQKKISKASEYVVSDLPGCYYVAFIFF